MDRFTALFVGGVLALIVASLATAVAARGQPTRVDLTTPEGVVLSYALALQDQQPAKAWELLTTEFQEKRDRDQFLAIASFDDGALLSTESAQIDGASARVTLIARHASSGLFGGYDGYNERTPVVLVREGANWRISVPPHQWMFQPRKPA
jgi:hypothetical protein